MNTIKQSKYILVEKDKLERLYRQLDSIMFSLGHYKNWIDNVLNKQEAK